MRTFILGRWYDEETDRFDGQREVTDVEPHMAQFMQKPEALKPCRSPYCECTEGSCTHPGHYDARRPGACVNHKWSFTGGSEAGSRFYRCRECDAVRQVQPGEKA